MSKFKNADVRYFHEHCAREKCGHIRQNHSANFPYICFIDSCSCSGFK